MDEDYDEVMEKMPDIIKDAEKKAGEVLEPTIYERREVMDIIKDYIRKKKRKVYGGTALNETLKQVNPDDAIYDENFFSDIEFYSPTPVPDLVELTNILYEKKYKYVQGKEAQHEETYSVFVNFQLYCDISYVPTRVYNGIKTIEIEGINYVHPHFMLIDYLRMINNPITSAAQRWEKAFKRTFKLLKNYPLEYFDKQIKIDKPSIGTQEYLSKIKNEFMSTKEIQETSLLSGFEAYNFFIRHAAGDRFVEQMARVSFAINKLSDLVITVPFIDIISVNYADTVERLFNFIKQIVDSPKEITIDEYFPLFQFTNHSVIINYKGIPLAKIYELDGFCIPNIKTNKGYMYVTYQYLLMSMLVNKFRAHLDKDRNMYFNYGIAISNLVNARNAYLTQKNLGVINNSVFGEFRIGCIGSTISNSRVSLLRSAEKIKQGKSAKFIYNPDHFFKQSEEAQEKFDATKHKFKNASGNKIINPKNLLFKIDSNGNIMKDVNAEEDLIETTEITETETETGSSGEPSGKVKQTSASTRKRELNLGNLLCDECDSYLKN
ncbi:MAG: polyA polymerase catalitic subunit [Satyrvirus sp.]|uniref:Putative poly(A) polymerase catalytic subunit n=1 Tax=Satyrvirus sp. TaxID=2487771 RepID=A0A3G5AF35_9VIRU|nr:MAG: polyA polymerase catalitic subunit [Satyrvirus sp.]